MAKELTRKTFLLGTTGLAAAATSCATGVVPRAPRRPNVLLVIADEWRAQAFGYMGDVNAHTPALDRFHLEAVNFNQAIAGTPVCCPARASLMTGTYPLTNGVYINDVALHPRNLTLGEAFARAGYRTGYIGKWHLYGSPEGRYERRLAYIPPEQRYGFQYWKAAECTHDYNHSIYYSGNDSRPRYWEGYDAIAQTDDALAFINAHHDKDDPYFLVLSWGPPHFPYSAPEEYAQYYRARDLALRSNVPAEDRDNAINELRGYYAAIAVLDDCFARLLEELDRMGADDTIVVFMSDHGDMLWSQGLRYKLYPWEESIRIPFMVRYPHAFGRRSLHTDALLNMPDVMPTLLGLAGVPAPHGLQGHNHAQGLLGRPGRASPQSALLSLPVPITSARTYGVDAYRGVRTARYTYVRSMSGPWLLYDNVADPYQMNNRIDDPDFAAARATLECELDSWLRRLGDDFLAPELYLQRDQLTHFFEARAPVGEYESPWGDWRSTLAIPVGQGRTIDTALSELLANPTTAAIVNRITPQLGSQAAPFDVMSPRALSVIRPAAISSEQLRALELELERLSEDE
ncbi:MAG: sulfatase [Hyphomonadaceae bacterium]